jgi:protein-S-isoprenylcysteine O-methyltransferase Ste14
VKKEAVPPPTLLFFACLLCGYGLDRLIPARLGLDDVGLRLFIALPLLAGAAAFGAWALAALRRHGTSPEPGAVPTALVVSGPYRLSRNPLYLALVAVLSAFAVLLDSVWILLAALGLALLLDRLVIAREEARMAEVFDDAFARYASRVRRWL